MVGPEELLFLPWTLVNDVDIPILIQISKSYAHITQKICDLKFIALSFLIPVFRIRKHISTLLQLYIASHILLNNEK